MFIAMPGARGRGSAAVGLNEIALGVDDGLLPGMSAGRDYRCSRIMRSGNMAGRDDFRCSENVLLLIVQENVSAKRL